MKRKYTKCKKQQCFMLPFCHSMEGGSGNPERSPLSFPLCPGRTIPRSTRAQAQPPAVNAVFAGACLERSRYTHVL